MQGNDGSQWTRRNYPLQAVTKGSTPEHLTSAASQAGSPASYTSLNSTHSGSDSVPRYSDIYRSRSSSEDPVPTYSLMSIQHGDNDSIPVQPEEEAPVAKSPKPWTRHVYPMQALTEGSTPQQSSLSPREEAQGQVQSLKAGDRPSAAQHSDKGNNSYTYKSNQWSRHKYPMHPSAQATMPEHVQKAQLQEASEPLHVEAMEPRKTNTVERTSPWSRRSYPLQKLKECPKCTGSPEQPPSREETSTPKPGKTTERKQSSTAKPSPWNKKTYPLESSINETPTQHPITTQTKMPEEMSGGLSSETPIEKKPRVGDKKVNAWNRQKYPLQLSKSDSSEHHSASTTSTEKGSVPKEQLDTEELSSSKPSNNGMTGLRQRKKYPLQSSVNASVILQASAVSDQQNKPEIVEVSSPKQLQRSNSSEMGRFQQRFYATQSTARDTSPPPAPLPTPPPSDHDSESARVQQEEATASPVHLPRTLRAVQDDRKVAREGRTIVVCLDGTGDKFDNDNSNIVHLVSCLKKDDPTQVTYYQAGIGTYSDGGLSSGFSSAMDMAIGSELGLHVRDAYRFLMHTYKEGDKICIFGFSRGAYTARCLAGMIHKVGLLPPRNIQQIPFAYEFYAMDTAEGWKQSADFKKTFCIDVNVYFLGVFDSVDSVGFIPRRLPLSSTPTNRPRHFRHALALDERRAKFKACRHQTTDWDDIGKHTGTVIDKVSKAFWSILPSYQKTDDVPPVYSERKAIHGYSDITDEEYAMLMKDDGPKDTDVLEVWFLGAHADVGGGAVPNEERHKLSHVPLRWIIRQCFECNTGILFKTKALAENGLDVHTLWPKYQPAIVPTHLPSPTLLEKYEKGLPPRSVRRSKLVPIEKEADTEGFYGLNIFDKDQKAVDEEWTPEHLEDFFDAMCDVHDQLIAAPVWWILELWPVSYKMPKPNSRDFYATVGMNWGRYRAVEDHEPKMHWTVMQRMQHQGYKIQARTNGQPQWKAVA